MQANKAGLLEIADIFVINKADRPGVHQARHDLEQMLDLTVASDWRPPIVETTGSTGEASRCSGARSPATGPTRVLGPP